MVTAASFRSPPAPPGAAWAWLNQACPPMKALLRYVFALLSKNIAAAPATKLRNAIPRRETAAAALPKVKGPRRPGGRRGAGSGAVRGGRIGVMDEPFCAVKNRAD